MPTTQIQWPVRRAAYLPYLPKVGRNTCSPCLQASTASKHSKQEVLVILLGLMLQLPFLSYNEPPFFFQLEPILIMNRSRVCYGLGCRGQPSVFLTVPLMSTSVGVDRNLFRLHS